MPTLYLDPVSGNDGNDGLSFANRKKTLGSVTTASALGDTIRVIASPAPHSVGSASWTDNSGAVTFTNGANKLLDACNSGWVGVTNVTVTHPTSGHMTGTADLSCNIAAAFTTGKLAYKTLGAATSFSGFQQIGFYFQVSSTSTTVMNIKIALCSDTTGDTVVDEVNVVIATTAITANVWRTVMVDKGSSFTGTLINSIAIYANADPHTSSARTFLFDNLVACKAPNAADLIDLHSLIGKNTGGEPEWYPIRELSENGVTIGANIRSTVTVDPPRPYRGTTESVTTFITNPLLTNWSTAESTINRGVTSNLTGITISGGWDRTNMSSQTGVTWLSSGYLTNGITNTSSNNGGNTIEKIGLTHCTTGFSGLNVADKAGVTPVYHLLGLLACEVPMTYTWGAVYRGYFELTIDQIWGSWDGFKNSSVPGKTHVKRIHGYTETTAGEAGFQPQQVSNFNQDLIQIDKIDNCTFGVLISGGPTHIYLSGTVFENNDTNLSSAGAGITASQVSIHLDNLPDYYQSDGGSLAGVLSNKACTLTQTRIGGDPNAHRTVHSGLMILESSVVQRHTASGVSWRMYPRSGWTFNALTKQAPLRFPIAQVAMEASKQVTASCWVYITSIPVSDAGFGIMIESSPFLGLSRSFTEANPATLNSWQQVTLQFTPSATGVVSVFVYGYGNGNGQEAYFDDFAVSKEA